MFLNNWTGTNSGCKINLTKPDLDQINIEDIANALSKVCRFNGQLKTFYSVAQHSIHVAEMVPTHLKLTALLHDASEAYICDVPTPLKKMLGSVYTDIEDTLSEAIGLKFGVELVNLDPLIKQADRIMVVSERDTFQANPLKWGEEYENVLRFPGNLQAYSPDSAKTKFLLEFKKYSENRVTISGGKIVAWGSPEPAWSKPSTGSVQTAQQWRD
jgi:5'-deoxynucleotidase YfbR-like HD superfamily hydrolase